MLIRCLRRQGADVCQRRYLLLLVGQEQNGLLENVLDAGSGGGVGGALGSNSLTLRMQHNNGQVPKRLVLRQVVADTIRQTIHKMT